MGRKEHKEHKTEESWERKREVTKRKEPRFSRLSALSATLLRPEVLTSKDPTFTDSGDVRVDKRKVSLTQKLTKRVELPGRIPHYLTTWRTQRNTLRVQKWFLPESRSPPKERILLLI